MSTKRILDKAIRVIDMSFKKGDTFKNSNGKVMKVLDPTKEGHIQIQSENRVFLTTPESFQNMLTKNGYKRTNDASYPAEVYKMLNEVSRIHKIDKNYIDIRSLGGDKYEYSDRLGDTIAVYNNKTGKLQMYK